MKNTGSIEYHEFELRIALDPNHPERLVPDIGDAQSILDIGCGAGQTLIALGNAKRRIGVDIDTDAVKLGMQWAAASGIRMLAARGENLPFQPDSFEFVYSRVALPYMDIPVALNEIHRVLRPGGRVWLTLHPITIPAAQFRRGNVKGKIYAAYVMLNGLWLHITGKTFRFLRGVTESFQTDRGIKAALTRAGFLNIEFHRTARHFIVMAQR